MEEKMKWKIKKLAKKTHYYLYLWFKLQTIVSLYKYATYEIMMPVTFST